MIIQKIVDNVERIGGGESQKFSIKVSRKSFQILSDLYSDKPLAVVRELGCNAFDSHTSAGKASLPISIHLPNSLEPHLEIRDFGTGISPEDVFSIYSTYFESTKTTSNDVVGCLGLGSKAGFCYSSSFTLTIRYNGVKRLYLAYFDEGGAPTITLASEEPDNEGNGVAIQIPVKKEDCDKFRQAAITAFKWFPVKPTITGAKIDWTELERKVVLEGKGWRILDKTSDRWGQQESYAVMGGVNYVLNSDKVSSDNRMILSNLIVEFPIGDLDFTPSRESLSYDDRTVQKLNARLAVVKSEIAAKATAEMGQVKYLNEAARIWQTLPDFVRRAIGNFTWKGVKIESVTASYREISKRSYRKNLHVSKRDYIHISEIARLRGISFTLEKKTTMWKVREFLNDNSAKTASVIVFEDDAKKTLIAAGVDPACFTCTSTLSYAKSANSTQRQIDKEVVGLATSHYQRFDSVNLRKAITAGAKYYAVKSHDNNATIKGKAFSKDAIRRSIFPTHAEQQLCVFVAPSKEKLVVAAGLAHVDTYVDKKLATLQTPAGQEYLAMKEVATSLRDNDNVKKFIKIAQTGKSNLAKHILMGEQLSALTKKFSDVAHLAGLCGVKAAAPAAKLPELSELEKHLLSQMNQYYSFTEKVYAEYEKLVEKTSANP